VLNWSRPVVGAGQDERVIGVELPRVRVGVLLAGAGEAAHRATAVRARDPRVGGAELELGQLPLVLDDVDGVEQRLGVDAVAKRGLDNAHVNAPSWVTCPLAAGGDGRIVRPRASANIRAGHGSGTDPPRNRCRGWHYL